jgi:hypothetical protein
VGASEALLAELRALGVACAAHATPRAEALAYARAWRYSHVLDVASSSLVRVSDQHEKSVLLEPQALASILSLLSSGAQLPPR